MHLTRFQYTLLLGISDRCIDKYPKLDNRLSAVFDRQQEIGGTFLTLTYVKHPIIGKSSPQL